MSPRSRHASFAGFRYAAEGMLLAYRTQPHFRFHLTVAAIIALLTVWLDLPATTIAVLVLVIGAVLFAELVNTALEVLVNLVSPDYHPLAKQIKDLAAAAVLMLAVTSVVVGLILIGPALLARLGWLSR